MRILLKRWFIWTGDDSDHFHTGGVHCRGQFFPIESTIVRFILPFDKRDNFLTEMMGGGSDGELKKHDFSIDCKV